MASNQAERQEWFEEYDMGLTPRQVVREVAKKRKVRTATLRGKTKAELIWMLVDIDCPVQEGAA